MLDLIWIIPNLNERISVVRENLLKCFNYSEKKGYKSKIILSDGGSSVASLCSLRTFVQKLNSRNVSTQIMLCLPAMHPNKNLGILNIVEKWESRYVVILDSDLLSLSEDCFDSLIDPLIHEKTKMTLPTIWVQSGRSNKLIINPFMRLFYPKIARANNFVLSGILGIDHGYLRKIVTSPDYCWDWGGEIQIICRGFELSNNSIGTFVHQRQDAKRRKLASKMKEARQVLRTLLYELSKGKRIDENAIKKNLELDWTSNKLPVKNFLEWQERNRVNIIQSSEDLNNCFLSFLGHCSRNKRWLVSYLDTIYDKTRAYEISVLKSIVVDTILRTLFGINLDYKPKEVGPVEIKATNLENISIFADVIFAVYIAIWLKEGEMGGKEIQYFLDLLSSDDTDFVDASALKHFRDCGLRSTDVGHFKVTTLKKIVEVYNDKGKGISKRNESLMHILGLWKK